MTIAATLPADVFGKLGKRSNNVLRRVIDRTATEFRRDVIDSFSAKTGGTKPAFRKLVRVSSRTSPGNFRATVDISKSALRVRDLSPAITRNTSIIRADIDVRDGRGAERLKRAFSPTGTTRKDRIWERVRKGGRPVPRLPLKLARGPSPAVMYGPIGDDLEREFVEILKDRLRLEIVAELTRIEGRKLFRQIR